MHARAADAVFGSYSDALSEGARNAVRVCLAIGPGDRVALIADEASAEVAASLAAALDESGAVTERVFVERVATRPLTEAPREVIDAVERADAGILCIQPREGELPARMAIVATVERRGIRYAHMVGVTPEIMRVGSTSRPATCSGA